MLKRSALIHSVFSLAAICLLFSPVISGQAKPATTREIDYGGIDGYVQDAMKRAGSPGLAYAIVHGDQIVHVNTFGIAGPGNRPVTASTPFILGSVGKTFTALAIRQLIHAGQIDPRAHVQSYIPWFSVSPPQTSALITVQNLLDHKSGIPTSAGNQFYQLDERYGLEELVRRARSIQLTSAPGTQYEYSNVNFLVLGLIIEKISGQSYAEYVEQRIFAPLAMHHTYLDEAEAQRNGLAAGYQSWYGLFFPVDAPFPRGMQPSGYAISTVLDMGNYLIAYLNEGIYQGVSVVAPDAGITRMKYTGYDIYWNERPLDPNVMEGQSGGTLNFNADIQIIPESQWGIVVLMNSRWTLDGLLPAVTAASIANGIACRIKGWPTLPEAPLTYRQSYIIVDCILLCLVAFGVYRLLSLPKWRKGVLARRNLHLPGCGLSIAVDLLVASMLMALPVLKDYSLIYFLFALPDIAIVLCSVAVILGLSALLKLLFLTIAHHANKQDALP